MRFSSSLKERERHFRQCMVGVLAASLAAVFMGSGAPVNAQLIITPTFDASITSDSNAAAIQAAINGAIAVYQAAFTDPINVLIKFQSMNTGLGSSNTTLYKIGYSSFYAALTADAGGADDASALANTPGGGTNPVTGSSTINVKTANLRALGVPGSFPPIGGFDGIVGLNTHITDIGSSDTTGQYSLLAVIEHEIDEVLGLGSDVGGTGFFSDPAVEDLFRFNFAGARTYTTAGDDAYFSIDGGATQLARFNQNGGGDYGDWWSNNGGGNPGPVPAPQVQDAFAFPGTHPVLGVELRALDVIGYNRNIVASVPEPGSIALLVGLGVSGSVLTLRRRVRK
jgi:hypothetical protein